MKKSIQSAFFITTPLLLGLFTGCESTVSSAQAKRASEQPAAYTNLPPADQEQVSRGQIARGHTPDLVYIALGKPDRIIASADGRVMNWVYQNYLPPPVDPPKSNSGLAATDSPRQAHRNVRMTDPLLETMEAWRANAPRFTEASGETDVAPKSPNQSWADYGRALQERSLLSRQMDGGNPMAPPTTTRGLSGDRSGIYTVYHKAIDTTAWNEYNESIKDSPVQTPDTVKLEVVFIDQRVSDAIVNESLSAFTPHL